jgi:hypothetical protein
MIPVFLIKPFLDLASSVWAKSEEQWIDDAPRAEDIAMLKKEAEEDSSIDTVNFRKEVLKMWTSKQNCVELKVRELPQRTRVVFLGTSEQWSKIPWALWARLFQAIGNPVGRILFYAHPSQRFFPAPETQIGPDNINGGYTNICSQERIVIYRYEEATRVLLHELLHTACLDTEKQVEDLEAHTEAWAELFLCAILSKGSLNSFRTFWKQQCLWIKAQVQELDRLNVKGPESYAWRYTTGKSLVLYKLGFIKDYKDALPQPGLRFTTPQWPL